jgi:hypothetical protein
MLVLASSVQHSTELIARSMKHEEEMKDVQIGIKK